MDGSERGCGRTCSTSLEGDHIIIIIVDGWQVLATLRRELTHFVRPIREWAFGWAQRPPAVGAREAANDEDRAERGAQSDIFASSIVGTAATTTTTHG